MVRRRIYTCLLTILLSSCLLGQTGGRNVYPFLNINSSPRLSAMSVDFVSIYDNDLELVASNPSLINSNMHNDVSVAYVDYFSDINIGHIAYSRTFDKVGSFAATINYFNYGSFQYADWLGLGSGTFTANDIVAIVGWGRALSPCWHIGANMKMIFSSMEKYNSFGVAVDVAGTYRIEKKRLDMSFIIKNAGAELKTYSGIREYIPFGIEYALSHQLAHLPFRFTVLLHDLQRWNMIYPDANNFQSIYVEPSTGNAVGRSKGSVFVDNIFRHVSIGGEFNIKDIIFLRLGFDYRCFQEYRLSEELRTFGGFSFGLGLNIYKFDINYAHSVYARGGAPNYFSIKTKISDWIK